MNIKLHNITCDSSVLDKTAYLNTTPADMTAVFNSLIPQDLLNPVLIVDSTINPSNYNYVYITDLNAYYFITRCIILSNGRYELRLEKDVLFSNLSIIKNSYAIIKRSYNNGDVDLKDDTDAFGEKEKFDFIDLTQYNISEFHLTDFDTYLLVYYDGYMNDLANHPESALFTLDADTYDDGIKPNINANPYTLGYKNNTNYRVLDAQQLVKLSWAVGNDSQLLSMIKGIYKIPMQTSETNELKFRVVNTNTTTINLGTRNIDLDYDNVHKLYAPYSYRSRWTYQSFTLFQNNLYKNYYYQNPYRKYEIWCPFVSWIEIPSAYIINRNLKIYYTLNLENGESTCNIYDVASETIIATQNANMLLPISLSAMNMRELEERKTALTLNTIIGGVSSALAIVGGGYTGNMMAVAGGVISASKIASSAITGFTQLHPSGNVKLQNTNQAWQSRITFVLRTTYKQISRIIETRIGRPCNRHALISSEQGYFECTGLILSSNAGLCKDEIDKIKILVEKGCFAS